MASTSAQTAARDAKKRANSQQDNHPITDKAQAAMHSGIDTVADKAAGAEHKVRESLGHGADALQQKQQEVQQAWRQSPVRKFARRNPVATAGIAFTAGVLLTSLLRGRK